MTTVEQIEASNRPCARQVRLLIAALVLVAAMVGGVGILVFVGTAPAASNLASAARPKIGSRPNGRVVSPDLQPECRQAIARAKEADKNRSSDQAIKAATDMLRVCDVH